MSEIPQLMGVLWRNNILHRYPIQNTYIAEETLRWHYLTQTLCGTDALRLLEGKRRLL